jgi:hypothetical protein
MTCRIGQRHSGAPKSQNDVTAEVAVVVKTDLGRATAADHHRWWFDPPATDALRQHRNPQVFRRQYSQIW